MNALLSVFLLCCSQDSGVLVATIPDGVRPVWSSFSKDGKTVGYCAMKGSDHWVVVGDWKSQPTPFPSMVVLLENGKDFVYVAFGRGGSSVYFRDKLLFEQTNPREWAWQMPGAVSSDGSVVANYVRHLKSGKSGIAINGKLSELHAGTGSSPALSRDGKTWAFALETEDGHCVVVNDKPGPVFDWVTQPAIAIASGVVGYGAESGKEFFLILGDQKLPLKKSPKGVFVSADGKKAGSWGLAKKGDLKGGFQVVVDDREGPSFATIQAPAFSPDGKHLLYRATKADGTWVVVVDDRIVDAEGIQADPVFMADGKQVGYGILKGNEIRWKTLGVD